MRRKRQLAHAVLAIALVLGLAVVAAACGDGAGHPAKQRDDGAPDSTSVAGHDPAAMMGMRVDNVTQDNGIVTVRTTGARVTLDPNGLVTLSQQIGQERKVFEMRLPEGVSAFEVIRKGPNVEVSNAFVVFTIRPDSTVVFIPRTDMTVRGNYFIDPTYVGEDHRGKSVIDHEGGFALYWISRLPSTSEDPAQKMITAQFHSGDEVWVAIFPQRPHDLKRYYTERLAWAGTDSQEEGTSAYPKGDLIKQAAKYTQVLVVHAGIWKADGRCKTPNASEAPTSYCTARNTPWNPGELQRVLTQARARGLRVALYFSPLYTTARDQVEEIKRIIDTYKVGLYFDLFPYAIDERYRIIQATRAMLGPDGLLILHDSLNNRDTPGAGGLLAPDNAYGHFTLRGEEDNGRQGYGLDDFLRDQISESAVSGSVGYWVYDGSNIDIDQARPGGGPECTIKGETYCNFDSQGNLGSPDGYWYQSRTEEAAVPTRQHINAALRHKVGIWYMPGYWPDEKLPRFAKEYFGGLDADYRAWLDGRRQ